MNLTEIKDTLKSPLYDFLRSNENLNHNVFLLGLGGSYAYGTENEDSDLDIRGIAANSKRNIMCGKDFEQVVDAETDTTIYSFGKMVKLLCSCNPNVIEILGLKPEHYLYLTDIGKELLDNRKIFLSKLAVSSFGGYANAQLRRLENKAARLVSQRQQEQYILDSINHASVAYRQKYFPYTDDEIKLYVDKSEKEDYDSEIYMDLSLKHYPLRDFKSMYSEMSNIIEAYSRIGKRNEKAIAHNKLSKHMMHLVRLYLMCFDILELEEIRTYRSCDHDMLMNIRNGAYLDENRQPTAEFYALVDSLQLRLEYDAKHTSLPEHVDMNKVDDLVYSINEKICKSEDN